MSFHAEAVHRVRQINAVVGGDLLHDFHAAVKVGVEGQDDAAVGNRLNQLGDARFATRKEYDAGNSGFCCKGGEGGRGVSRAGASDSVDRFSALDHRIDLTDKNRHAEIFKTARMRISAEFDPQLFESDFFSERLGVKQRAPTFAKSHNVLFGNFGQNHFPFAPDAAHVGGFETHPAFGKELFPFVRGTFGECIAVMMYFKKAPIDLAAVNNFV